VPRTSARLARSLEVRVEPASAASSRSAIIPLFAIGFAYGTTSTIYVAFAADHMVVAGGVPGVPVGATPALVSICYGVFGLAGLLTVRIKAIIGLPLLLRLLMLAGAVSVALVAIAPNTWLCGPRRAQRVGKRYAHRGSAALDLWYISLLRRSRRRPAQHPDSEDVGTNPPSQVYAYVAVMPPSRMKLDPVA
jgi:hypothetical protein